MAVAHERFRRMQPDRLAALFGDGPRVLLDLKGELDCDACVSAGYRYWRL
ncbi:MAG: hypothetical protein IKG21_12125 [Atopobiaceae bacterium]|nr:hypothetical protein [Atopobiaceae bacterium]